MRYACMVNFPTSELKPRVSKKGKNLTKREATNFKFENYVILQLLEMLLSLTPAYKEMDSHLE